MKKLSLLTMAAMMIVVLSACSSSKTTAPQDATQAPAQATTTAGQKEAAASEPSGTSTFTLKIASDYSSANIIGQHLDKWAGLANERGNGLVNVVVYPDNQLGGKTDCLDSLFMGEPVVVGGDPAFMAEYGAPDLGILFGPFLFSSNEEVERLVASDWFKDQCKKLEDNGLKIIGSNWITGTRHLLTNDPVKLPEDMKGMKVRVPTNQIQTESFNVLGATATAMDLSEVYSALQSGIIDGAENPLSTLYDRKLQEVSKNLLLTGHVRVISMWAMSLDVWNGLTAEQQEIITSTLEEVGEVYNDAQVASDADYLKLMVDEGVTYSELSESDYQAWVKAAEPFYAMGDKFGWSDGLYETVLAAKKG